MQVETYPAGHDKAITIRDSLSYSGLGTCQEAVQRLMLRHVAEILVRVAALLRDGLPMIKRTSGLPEAQITCFPVAHGEP